MFHHHHKGESTDMKEEKVALKKQIKELKKKRDGLIELTKRGLAPLEEIVHVLKEKEVEMEMRLHRLDSEAKDKEKQLAELDRKRIVDAEMMEQEWKAKTKELKRAYKKKEQDMEETLKKKEQEMLCNIKKKEAEIEAKHQANVEARQRELDEVIIKKFEMEERIALLEKEFNAKKKWFDILQSAHERQKLDLSSSSNSTMLTSSISMKDLKSDEDHPPPLGRKMSAPLARTTGESIEALQKVKVVSCWALDVGRFKFSACLLMDLQLNMEELLPSDSWAFVQESSLGEQQRPFVQLAFAEVMDGVLSMKYALSTNVNHKKKVAPVVIILLTRQRASDSVSEALQATQKFLTDETKAPIFLLNVDGEGRLIPPALNDENAESLRALADFLAIVALRGGGNNPTEKKKEK